VISGKGGTGKTSIVGSFASLASDAVVADCDVDAPDLHLLLSPVVRSREDFSGGKIAKIDPDLCTECGECRDLCRFDAILEEEPTLSRGKKTFRVDPVACEGCGVCEHFCGPKAIEMVSVVNGEWFVSDTRFGPMVHAKLGVAQENSGKLVCLVRNQAKKVAEERGLDLVLIDGSPGIGCPVIASIAGADLVLVVTEPTLSGLHDLGRIVELTEHFGIETVVCINKYDLNRDLANKIEREVNRRGLYVAGRIRYDRIVTRAQIERKTVTEHSSTGAAADIKDLWVTVSHNLECAPAGQIAKLSVF
jgi:MinD superfamily P-loop ATPase